MKRYRVRRPEQADLVGPQGLDRLEGHGLFGREAPWRLDIGCGHGEFISALAAAHPDEDHLGVERDDLRVTKTAHKSLKVGAANVRLFRDEAHRFVRCRIPPGRLHRAYVLFPDPWPKAGHRRRRLLTRAFILDLAWAMAPGGLLVIGSDTHEYVFQALANAGALPGLWSNRLPPDGFAFDLPTRFPTVFERHKKAEGHRIAYLRLERTAVPPPPRLDPPVTRPVATASPHGASP